MTGRVSACAADSFTMVRAVGILPDSAMAKTNSLTERLKSFMNGDRAAADVLLREILPKLHEIAVRELNRGALYGAAFEDRVDSRGLVSNLSKGGWQIQDQGHFYALASLAMRRVLVDLARRSLAACRGGGETTLPLDASAPAGQSRARSPADCRDRCLMERLEAKDPDAARMVDMHYFSGFTLEEIAKETGLTVRQVRFRWEQGMKWLKRTLNPALSGNGRSCYPDPTSDSRSASYGRGECSGRARPLGGIEFQGRGDQVEWKFRETA